MGTRVISHKKLFLRDLQVVDRSLKRNVRNELIGAKNDPKTKVKTLVRQTKALSW